MNAFGPLCVRPITGRRNELKSCAFSTPMTSILENVRTSTHHSEADGGQVALLDWRRQISQLYADVRATDDIGRIWHHWRRTRDHLFQSHPQSPFDVPARQALQPMRYFAYDPAFRLRAALDPYAGPSIDVETGGDGITRMQAFARTRGLKSQLGAELPVYWILGYGGGVFVPFADATNGRQTYGGGRYVLDTVKGADLGSRGNGDLILDFNFAYNPSCAYSPRWVCPLPPAGNRVPAAIRAGEMAYVPETR